MFWTSQWTVELRQLDCHHQFKKQEDWWADTFMNSLKDNVSSIQEYNTTTLIFTCYYKRTGNELDLAWIIVGQRKPATVATLKNTVTTILPIFTKSHPDLLRCSWSWQQSLDIWQSNLHCCSCDVSDWDVICDIGSLSSWVSWEHSIKTSWLLVHALAISWSSWQLWSWDKDGWRGTGGTRKGCLSSWGILHLSLRSHARHFFMRSRSHGLETGPYVISWFGSVITLNLDQKVLYSAKGVLP